MKPRTLTIQQTGDWFKDKAMGRPPKLQIRIEGRWLNELGFRVGETVIVYQVNDGLFIGKEMQDDNTGM